MPGPLSSPSTLLGVFARFVYPQKRILRGRMIKGIMKALIDHANRVVWKDPDLELLHRAGDKEYPLLTQVLQRELRIRHAKGKLLLPDLRAYGNDSVAVFS